MKGAGQDPVDIVDRSTRRLSHGDQARPDVRPTRDDIMASDDGARKLAGYMLRRNADRASSSASNGRAVIDFRFDH
jgi:hypothetical protein